MSIPVEISFYEMNIGILYQLFIRLFDCNGVFNDLLVMLIQIVFYLNFIWCNYDAKYVGWDSGGGSSRFDQPLPSTIGVIIVVQSV